MVRNAPPADDLFRLIHSERDGQLLLHPDVAGLVLAGALLGELVLTGHLTITAAYEARVVSRMPPNDAVCHSVLDHLMRETHPVTIWLPFLAHSVYGQVADRMVRGGHVVRRETRRLLTRRVTYRPADMSNAAWPWARLLNRLNRGDELATSDQLLGGLLQACDWHRTVLQSRDINVTETLRYEADKAPDAIRLLVGLTEAAVRNAVNTAT
ncbi:GOLPH3/VPS74 family protein [Actinoplanes flavus]|uniref:GPP34 family phosphoprotein n=1 Tax=Actinoplanes flavus TaxID=2820290 RepID=A0ABS3UD41_9ACTN|nr:GPP34 family phosphoprotein [Actinoplanes flavus]MBO3736694.1 GPP34 family phosphoprotein [Actinoplanes flavus]